MGLQEGLILLGAVVFLIVLLDAIRRKRAAARLSEDDYEDPEEIERRAQLARELPSLDLDGKKTASQKGLDPLFDDIEIFDDDPIPVLRNKQQSSDTLTPKTKALDVTESPSQPEVEELETEVEVEIGSEAEKEASLEEAEHTEEELAWNKMRRMFAVDPSFAEASRTSMVLHQKELQKFQEIKSNLALDQLNEQEEAEFEETLETSRRLIDYSLDDLVELKHPKPRQPIKEAKNPLLEEPEEAQEIVEISPEEREKDLRHALLTSLEKSVWGSSKVFLTINVNAPSERPFIGSHLRQFMEIIGMKLSESGFYHYVEEKDEQSYLGYSLVNMFSPGSFDPHTEEEFVTAGVVLVMPLPNAPRPMAIFERMLATARVMEKNWGAELKDEQRSNLTQQTIEHYRQTIKDFEYQTRVNAKKAGRA